MANVFYLQTSTILTSHPGTQLSEFKSHVHDLLGCLGTSYNTNLQALPCMTDIILPSISEFQPSFRVKDTRPRLRSAADTKSAYLDPASIEASFSVRRDALLAFADHVKKSQAILDLMETRVGLRGLLSVHFVILHDPILTLSLQRAARKV